MGWNCRLGRTLEVSVIGGEHKERFDDEETVGLDQKIVVSIKMLPSIKTIAETIAALDANPEMGLELWQVRDRQGVYGRNQLTGKAGRSKLSIFISHFHK